MLAFLKLALAMLMCVFGIRVIQQYLFAELVVVDVFSYIVIMTAAFVCIGLNFLGAFGLITGKPYAKYIGIAAVLIATWPIKMNYIPLQGVGLYFSFQLLITNAVCLIILILLADNSN